MSGLFEHLAADDSDRIRTSRKAIAVAKKRADSRFLNFVANSLSPDEREARVSLIEDELAEVVAAVCDEVGHDQPEPIFAAIKENLIAKGGFCDDCRKWKSGPKAGCTCGESSDSDDSSVAADEPAEEPAEEQESAVGASEEDREKTASDHTGLSDKPSGPAIQKRKWKPNALNEKGNLAPLAEAHGEHQDITEPADHSKNPVKDNQNLESVSDLGKEQKGPHTDTWNGTKDQADPVTAGFMDGLPSSDEMFGPDPWNRKEYGEHAEGGNPVGCPNCESPLQGHEKYCPECGSSVQSGPGGMAQHGLHDEHTDAMDPGDGFPDPDPRMGARQAEYPGNPNFDSAAMSGDAPCPTCGDQGLPLPGGMMPIQGQDTCPDCGAASDPHGPSGEHYRQLGQAEEMADKGYQPQPYRSEGDPGWETFRAGAVDPDKNPVAELLETGFDGFVPQTVVDELAK